MKLETSPVWWGEDWPVCCVSWEDLISFSAWLSMRRERIFTLPDEIQWEKSARGADGRFYPWGNEIDAAFCNMNVSHEGPPRPAGVDSFPVDESPCGVRGLAGNIQDFCLNDPGVDFPGWRVCRGGHWASTGVLFRSSFRAGFSSTYSDFSMGGRLAWLPRLGRMAGAAP